MLIGCNILNKSSVPVQTQYFEQITKLLKHNIFEKKRHSILIQYFKQNTVLENSFPAKIISKTPTLTTMSILGWVLSRTQSKMNGVRNIVFFDNNDYCNCDILYKALCCSNTIFWINIRTIRMQYFKQNIELFKHNILNKTLSCLNATFRINIRIIQTQYFE